MISLTTVGYRLEIGIGDLSLVRDGWSEVKIILALNDSLEGSLHAEAKSYSPTKDVVELADYFDKYVECLESGGECDDLEFTFMPISVAFRLRVHDGEYLEDGTGDLYLVSEVNVGKGSEYVYVGADSVVTLREVCRFSAELRELGRRLMG